MIHVSSLWAVSLNLRLVHPIRGFSKCLPNEASAKEHRRRKQLYKKAEDQQWRREKSMNPFMRNVGMARALNKLGVDAEDPVLGDTELGGRVEDNLETWRDESRAVRKQFKADEEFQKGIAKRKMVMKRMFDPEPSTPALLTWMEKEMIRYLHKKDPVQWDHERLAESFPATTGVIHKVLRERPCYAREVIEKYNKNVVNNWKLLSRGQLELEPKYHEHLKSGNRDLGLSSGEKNLAEQEIRIKCESSFALPKPAIPGEFASIIINYNKKLAKDKEEAATQLQGQEMFEMQSLFGDNTIPGTPVENEVSVYTDTALLASNIDLSREKQMDIVKFRNKYLKKGSSKEETDNPNPLREKYMEWVKKEEEKRKYTTEKVQKIEAAELSKISKDNQLLYEAAERDEVDVKISETGQTFVFDPESGYKQPYITPNNPDTIVIPEEMKNKYKFFQLGDSIYDLHGDFLYRIPGLA